MPNPVITAIGGNAIANLLPRPALYVFAGLAGWMLLRPMLRKRR